jgi:hypothetical protein
MGEYDSIARLRSSAAALRHRPTGDFFRLRHPRAISMAKITASPPIRTFSEEAGWRPCRRDGRTCMAPLALDLRRPRRPPGVVVNISFHAIACANYRLGTLYLKWQERFTDADDCAEWTRRPTSALMAVRATCGIPSFSITISTLDCPSASGNGRPQRLGI